MLLESSSQTAAVTDVKADMQRRLLELRLRGQRHRAAGELRRAIRRRPAEVALRLLLADVLIANGLISDARAVLLESLSVAGRCGDRQSRLRRFGVLVRLGRYERAFCDGEALLKEDRGLDTIRAVSWPWKNWVDAVHPNAMKAFRLRHLPALSSLIERRLYLPWAFYYRGLMSRKLGGVQAGGDDLDRAGREVGVHSWMLLEVGLSKLYRCDFGGAIDTLKLTLSSPRPDQWMTHAFIGEALVCQGRPQAAFRRFERAYRAAPLERKGEALAWHGEMYLWLGRYQEAVDVLDVAIKAGGRYAYAWRGAAKLRMGRVREAMADFDLGVGVWDDMEAWIWRGEAKRILGDHRGALRDLNRAEKLSCDPWIYFNRALVKGYLKDLEGLRRDFERIDPALIDRIKRCGGLHFKASRPSEMQHILETGLRLNAGSRRDLAHQRFVWAGPG